MFFGSRGKRAKSGGADSGEARGVPFGGSQTPPPETTTGVAGTFPGPEGGGKPPKKPVRK